MARLGRTTACLLAAAGGLAFVWGGAGSTAEARPARHAPKASAKTAPPKAQAKAQTPAAPSAKIASAAAPLPPAPPGEAAKPAAPPPDPLEVHVLTFGPGDHPFFKFGHDALWIHDAAAGTDRVYNFGTFKFDSPWLIVDFMQGRLTYWLSVSSLKTNLASYQRENRSIAAQTLDLAPEAKRLLQARLEENARPENRAYKYDYFLDNCSTRVRDAIDRLTEGAVHRAALGPARLTLREQALRMTADSWPLYVALDVVLSGSADRPVDRWAEMFIPEELARGLRQVTLADARGTHPLVSAEQMLFAAQRAPPLEHPPARGVTFLLAGLALGLLYVALGWATPGRPFVRWLFGGLVALWGLVAGFIGTFLAATWAFTDHVVSHRNENILQCAPWALLLVVLGLRLAAGSYGATRKALVVTVSALVFAIVGLLFKIHPAFHQANAQLIAFFIPVWIGITIGLKHVRDDPRVR
jgi:hypothetical protein